ncbi:MAG: diacylglycerol kinase [Pirellulales bacterium]
MSHPWKSKVYWALSGVGWGVRSQSNFIVHLTAAAAVVIAATLLRASLLEWCGLGLCIAIVLAAELFNTALEHLARAVTREHNEEIRHALDTSAGAVLVAATGAVLVGGAILINRLGLWLEWWR